MMTEYYHYPLMEALHPRHKLTLPDNFSVELYCYDFCSALAELYSTAAGVSVYDWIWDGSKAQIELVRRTPIWREFNYLYQYAELGNREQLHFDGEKWCFSDDSILFIIEWILGVNIKSVTSELGFDINIGKYLVHKFLARAKIDGIILDNDYVISSSETILPMTHKKGLNMFEVALLAGVANVRSVRNVTYDKSAPLNVVKEGRNVYVEVNEARRWLKGRPGFVPTQGINYDENLEVPQIC